MLRLRCGNIFNSDRSHELYGLRRGNLLNSSRGLGIFDVYRLCRRHLCCEHRIDVMRSLQRGHLLNSER